ncbi:Dyp-type peroxidase [Cryptosporangium aurantiacum]|uniref:Tat-translocated enzyme n=1 Tax=Cryptosporangium aurantiacum TaxID=134849 RepID=A0A1M7MG60_9ACTN|nr:Dyp-type peroxidase [Cryptosporangium aurantiacum]SHM89395.1 Tat-translocated enzyme [Cryptosporangium aurantiacum]
MIAGSSPWLRRAAVLAVLVIALLGIGAGPAAAHTVGGVGATNFRTTLEQFSGVPGVELRVVENGSRLELRDTTDTPVVVRGYQNEPYARVGPDGVFVNEYSPAYYLNTDRYGVTTVPESADPKKAPKWRKISGDQVFRWHDHRTHWMQTTLPPVVSQAPDDFHEISRWTVTLDHGGTLLTGSGTLAWVPGPAPWGWFAAAAVLLVVPALVVAFGRRWALPVLGGVVALIVVADVVHNFGATLLEGRGAVASLGPQVAVWGIGGVAVWLLVRRRDAGPWAAAVFGVCVAIASGIADLPVFWRSSAPTVLPLGVDRLTVVVGLGVGFGLVGALALQLLRGRHGQRVVPLNAAPEAAAAVPEAVPAAETVSEAGAGPRGVRISRRQAVGLAVAGGAGAVAGAGLQLAASSDQPTAAAPETTTVPLGSVGDRIVPFRGARQAGISTPVQRQSHARIAAFDLVPGADADALRALLQRWTTAAEALTAGRPAGDRTDTMTADSGPAGLTITVGFGPSLFGKADIPAGARPEALTPLPAFPGETLDATRSNGDLGVLVAADDSVVVFSALRTLEQLAAGVATPRWQFAGFTRGRGVTTNEGATVRNLMGQLDGTKNPKPSEATFGKTVFVADDGWMRGGSYLVVRRIRMLLDEWEDLPVAAQEQVIGRKKASGAPLSGGVETTPANFGRRGSDGELMIPADSHMRLATAAFNRGAAMLRRGYSFADPQPGGGVEAGLIFLAWQADPRTGFIPVQQNLIAGHDRLSAFTRHETSALFAMPGGVATGEFLGQRLFDEVGR